jgi:hypothetical protein
MAEQAPESTSLPDAPNLGWLRKQAKRRVVELRQTDSAVRLADAQLDLARQYGFSSWRSLKKHVDSLTVEGQLFDACANRPPAARRRRRPEHPRQQARRRREGLGRAWEGPARHPSAAGRPDSRGALGEPNGPVARGLLRERTRCSEPLLA